jgi:divalent metal cation (Fe/Co/Zn/Cd) transporter
MVRPHRADRASAPSEPEERARRRALQLEWATNAWNAMEVVVTVTLGVMAGSLALIAFGLDSLVEVFASTVVIRHLEDTRPDPGDARTHRSLRLIAVAFFLLSGYLLVAGIRSLALAEPAASSPPGIAYMGVTACVMFALATAKRRLARTMGSEPLEREAQVTYLDSALSIGVLAALVANPLFGWWWADPVAACGIGVYAAYAGVSSWRQGAPHETTSTTSGDLPS